MFYCYSCTIIAITIFHTLWAAVAAAAAATKCHPFFLYFIIFLHNMKLYEREYTHTRTHNHTHTQALFFVCVLFTVNYFNLVVIVGAVFFSVRNSSTKCVHNTSIEYIRLPKHSFKLEFLNCAVANTQTVVSFAANTEITLKNSDIRAYICVSAVQRTQTAPMCA